MEGVTAFQQIEYDGDVLIMTAPPEEIVSDTWLLIHAEQRTHKAL
jgi:hypothetical protein